MLVLLLLLLDCFFDAKSAICCKASLLASNFLLMARHLEEDSLRRLFSFSSSSPTELCKKKGRKAKKKTPSS